MRGMGGSLGGDRSLPSDEMVALFYGLAGRTKRWVVCGHDESGDPFILSDGRLPVADSVCFHVEWAGKYGWADGGGAQCEDRFGADG